MPPKPPELGDLIFALFVGLGVSHATASLFAPLVVTLFGWACGMAWAVRNRGPDLKVWPFAASTLLTSLGVTSTLAAFVSGNLPDGWSVAPNGLLFITAGVITYHGDALLGGIGRLLPEGARAFFAAKARVHNKGEGQDANT